MKRSVFRTLGETNSRQPKISDIKDRSISIEPIFGHGNEYSIIIRASVFNTEEMTICPAICMLELASVDCEGKCNFVTKTEKSDDDNRWYITSENEPSPFDEVRNEKFIKLFNDMMIRENSKTDAVARYLKTFIGIGGIEAFSIADCDEKEFVLIDSFLIELLEKFKLWKAEAKQK